MPAYVVVDIEIHDPVRYEEYRRVWASPEYAPAKAMRQASAHTNMVVVAGRAG